MNRRVNQELGCIVHDPAPEKTDWGVWDRRGRFRGIVQGDTKMEVKFLAIRTLGIVRPIIRKMLSSVDD